VIRFSWDDAEDQLTPYMLWHFSRRTNLPARRRGVYILTNYNSSTEQDLYRVYKTREMGFNPYVMIWRKSAAPRETRMIQRWVNNKRIFNRCRDFSEYYADGKEKQSGGSRLFFK
jgi:hypothetical protein